MQSGNAGVEKKGAGNGARGGGEKQPPRVEAAQVLEGVAALLRERALDALRQEQLTPGGLSLLQRVADHPGITTSQLGAMTATTRQAASKAAQALVTQGLLQGVTHPTDKRSVQLQLTAAGKRALQKGRARMAADQGRVLTPLSDSDVNALIKLLTPLLPDT